jgi:hypothetical protein
MRVFRIRITAGGEPPAVAAARTRAHGEDHADKTADEELGEPLAIDVDSTISIAHSDDKGGAGATFRGTWGFHPLLAYLDRGLPPCSRTPFE